MTETSRNPPRLAGQVRAGAVLLLGMIGLHWLRYLPENGAGVALHSEIAAVTPWLIVFAGAAALVSLLFSARARRHLDRDATPFEVSAARYTAALLLCFLFQELLEFAWVADAGKAIDALVGPATLLLLPACFFIGVLATLAARTLDRFEERLTAARGWLVLVSEPTPPLLATTIAAFAPAGRPLAFGLARRPPPLSLSV